MKRSAEIALVLMGTVAVGSTAYLLMPRDCSQPQNLSPEAQVECRNQRSSSSSGSGGHGSGWSSSSSDSRRSGTSSTSNDASGTQRSGFGSFASHFSLGG